MGMHSCSTIQENARKRSCFRISGSLNKELDEKDVCSENNHSCLLMQCSTNLREKKVKGW